MDSLRELFWASQEVYLNDIFLPIIIGVLIFVPVLVLIFIFGFCRRYRLWKVGQAEKRSEHWFTRLIGTLAVAFANVRIIRRNELYPGIMHLLLFSGSALLILGKIVRLFSYITGITNPPQAIFLYASLVSEIGAVLIIIGGCMAVYRRYIVKPPRLNTEPDDTLVFIWVAIIVLTGLMVKGYRIASSPVSPVDWAMWSPVGYLVSYAFPTFLTVARNEILVWHRAIIHTVPAFILLGYIWLNRSRLQHILLSPLNVYFRSLKPRGALIPINLEETELFGAAKIEDFTWKQIMDLDACTRCGRCQDNCPAFSSGKPLSPKKVVQDLKTHLQEVYPIPLVKKPIDSRRDMILEVITEDVIWNCTTCYACQHVCPVWVEPMSKLIEMRRNLVLEKATIPESGEGALKSLEARGHPWRGTTLSRVDWAEGLDIKPLADDRNVDMLFWVGCTEALEERSTKVARSIARILKLGGIKFGILGTEETCCGDPARRMGNEYLYQLQAQSNIELLKNYGINKIVTGCPHCYNTLKYEYPQFGGNFEVIHHTELIAGLLKEGKLKMKGFTGGLVTYHDSCYLGRYNGIYETPRQILKSIPDIKMVEMKQNRERGFCCGAGGGHLWLEEQKVVHRINEMRTEQAMDVKAQVIATACPYCLQMFEDGIKAKEAEESLKVTDIAEIIAASNE